MHFGNTPKPGWRFAPCAAALALSLALPAYAHDRPDGEERDDNTQPVTINFDNPCTPDHLEGQGQSRNESRTTNKHGTTEFRQRTRVTGRPIGTPSLAIYNFSSDDNIVTRSSATTFSFKERQRVQGIPDRKTGATGLPVAAFFITHIQETVVSPKQNKNKDEQDTKCKDRRGNDHDWHDD